MNFIRLCPTIIRSAPLNKVSNLSLVQVSETEDLPEHGVTVCFVKLPNTKIELLYPLGENR